VLAASLRVCALATSSAYGSRAPRARADAPVASSAGFFGCEPGETTWLAVAATSE